MDKNEIGYRVSFGLLIIATAFLFLWCVEAAKDISSL